MVGDDDGLAVGRFVGVWVGNMVGLTEGLSEGLLVGSGEGEALGDLDGDALGLVDGAGVSLQPNSRLGLSGLRCQAGRLCVSQRKIGAVLIIWVSFVTRLVVADSGAKNFSHVDGPAVRLDGDTRALL
mgnify:CR=1 FL=1